MRAFPVIAWIAPVAWLLVLAWLPWWLGLPLLLSLVAVLLFDVVRLRVYHGLLRRALRWGLPGVILALELSLGGDALAWTIAAVAALAGFTLLAGLEAWLDRDLRRLVAMDDAATPAPLEWPEQMLAVALVTPAIIELQPLHWLHDSAEDPRGGRVVYCHGPGATAGFHFDDGAVLPMPVGRFAFSPGGRWLALETNEGVRLWDRDRQRHYPVRGRRLCGWYQEQPWLQRRPTTMPEPFDGSDEAAPEPPPERASSA